MTKLLNTEIYRRSKGRYESTDLTSPHSLIQEFFYFEGVH